MLFAVKNLNIYQTNPSVHGMNARQQYKLHTPLVRLSSVQRCVHYSPVKMFHQLPQNTFKYCNNIHIFKTFLRDYIVKNSIQEFFSTGKNNADI
jgi:hypothetical protein